jgi:hypothetical protein
MQKETWILLSQSYLPQVNRKASRNSAASGRNHVPSLFLDEHSLGRKRVIHSTLTMQVMDMCNPDSVLWVSAATLSFVALAEFRHSLREALQHEQN